MSSFHRRTSGRRDTLQSVSTPAYLRVAGLAFGLLVLSGLLAGGLWAGAPPTSPSLPLVAHAKAQSNSAEGLTPTSTPTLGPTPCTGWRVVASPNVVLTATNQLLAVAAVSANNVWAVGYYVDAVGGGSYPRVLTVNWDGSAWAIVEAPNPGSYSSVLRAVAAISASDVWAAGDQCMDAACAARQPLFEHWDGTTWGVVPAPDTRPGTYLFGLAAVAANDVWATGFYQDITGLGIFQTLVMHWDGAGWSVVPSPNSGTHSNFLFRASARAANDVWAAGTACSTGDCGYFSGLGGAQTLIQHWDGAAWNIVPSPNSGEFGSYLLSISARSAGDAWAVGSSCADENCRSAQSLIEHWDGAAWSVVPSPNPGAFYTELKTVVALSANNAWASGTYSADGTTWGNPTMHWDGAAWAYVPVPNPGSADNDLRGLAAVGPNNIWAVGDMDSGSGERTQIQRYTGPCATSTATPCPMTFTDVRPEDYFYEPVRYLYCRGVISGYADGTFKPYNLTTRAQLAKIVVLAEGWTLYTPPTPTFRDVPATDPFYTFVETAYHQGIISGYGCGPGCLEYRPGNNVTRAQLCKIVVLAEGWTLYTPPTPSFRDVAPTDPFYTFIETAYRQGIISGYGCGAGCLEFRPGNNATRGQICKIVYLAVTAP